MHMPPYPLSLLRLTFVKKKKQFYSLCQTVYFSAWLQVPHDFLLRPCNQYKMNSNLKSICFRHSSDHKGYFTKVLLMMATSMCLKKSCLMNIGPTLFCSEHLRQPTSCPPRVPLTLLFLLCLLWPSPLHQLHSSSTINLPGYSTIHHHLGIHFFELCWFHCL
jgi:hypothetical protein